MTSDPDRLPTHAHPSRRAALRGALGLALATVATRLPADEASGARAGADPLAAWEAFDFDVLTDRMRLAATRDHAPRPGLGAPWNDLDYDEYRRLAFDTDRARWAGPKSDWQLHAYAPGWLFGEAVEIHEVVDGRARPLRFGFEDFRVNGAALAERLADEAFPGIAGFRLNTPLNAPGRFDEVVSFLGASYFRALGQGNVYGLSARGLAVNTAIGGEEEFPAFTAFWLNRPGPGDDAVTFCAALESPSVTGAFRFALRPGATTEIDVEARLFPRRDVGQLGIAPLTSMYLFGPGDRGRFDDFRPAVHDSDTLVVSSAAGDVARPLANPPRLGNSYIGTRSPRTFGLAQRGRRFEDFLDAEALYERRPSLMVEPLGDWGRGAVRLIEIPSDLEVNDNIVAFWVPDAPARAGDALRFAYRMHWGATPPGALPQTAHVLRSLAGKGGVSGVDEDNGHRKFVIDFSGGDLAEPFDGEGIIPRVTASGGTVGETVLSRIDPSGVWRLVIEVAAPEGAVVELRADLAHGDAPLTETWLYQWQT